MNHYRPHLLAGLLLILHAGLAADSARQKSATFDELPHLTAGYSYWHLNDFRLHPENGVLPQRLVGLPLLLDQPTFPDTQQKDWRKSDVWDIGDQFFHDMGNDLDRMLFQGRCMIIVLSILLGVLVYSWSFRLFGAAGGLLSLTLYALSPTMLAHARLITSDMAAALFLLAAAGCMWRQMHRLTWMTLLGGGLVMGLAFTAKMSAVLLVPMGAVMLIIRLVGKKPLNIRIGSDSEIQSRLRQALVIVGVVLIDTLIIIAVIWAMFGFRFDASAAESRDQLFWDWRAPDAVKQPLVKLAVAGADRKLLPEAYLYGFAFVMHHSGERRSFLNGQFSTTGWKHFFPYAMLVKTPIPTMLLITAGLLLCYRRWYALCPIWVLIVVYMGFAISGNINIGHRHLLPVYPAMLILAGAAVGQRRWGRVLIILCVIFLTGESLYYHPHQLSYFNQIVGGPRNGWRHLVDSSLDWGQDLPALKQYLDNHPDDGPTCLSYFGSASPEYYGIKTQRLASHWDTPVEHWPKPWTGGVYCVSATMLQAMYLRCGGNWCVLYEQAYQENRREVEVYQQGSADQQQQWLEEHGRKYWRHQIYLYEQLRFGRLAAMLRQRAPDDYVGYSIFIYHLTDQQVREILDGPPAELVAQPAFVSQPNIKKNPE